MAQMPTYSNQMREMDLGAGLRSIRSHPIADAVNGLATGFNTGMAMGEKWNELEKKRSLEEKLAGLGDVQQHVDPAAVAELNRQADAAYSESGSNENSYALRRAAGDLNRGTQFTAAGQSFNTQQDAEKALRLARAGAYEGAGDLAKATSLRAAQKQSDADSAVEADKKAISSFVGDPKNFGGTNFDAGNINHQATLLKHHAGLMVGRGDSKGAADVLAHVQTLQNQYVAANDAAIRKSAEKAYEKAKLGDLSSAGALASTHFADGNNHAFEKQEDGSVKWTRTPISGGEAKTEIIPMKDVQDVLLRISHDPKVLGQMTVTDLKGLMAAEANDKKIVSNEKIADGKNETLVKVAKISAEARKSIGSLSRSHGGDTSAWERKFSVYKAAHPEKSDADILELMNRKATDASGNAAKINMWLADEKRMDIPEDVKRRAVGRLSDAATGGGRPAPVQPKTTSAEGGTTASRAASRPVSPGHTEGKVVTWKDGSRSMVSGGKYVPQ